jgi:predicted nucleic acid-binding protein
VISPNVTHLIDSNVLLDVAENDPHWLPWSQTALSHVLSHGMPAINPLIFAEVSVGFSSVELLNNVLPETTIIRLPLPWEAAFLAGKAFLSYRRADGLKRSPMPDFYIGAHALVSNLTLVTRDPKRYRRHYARIKLIAPDTHFSDKVPA